MSQYMELFKCKILNICKNIPKNGCPIKHAVFVKILDKGSTEGRLFNPSIDTNSRGINECKTPGNIPTVTA